MRLEGARQIIIAHKASPTETMPARINPRPFKQVTSDSAWIDKSNCPAASEKIMTARSISVFNDKRDSRIIAVARLHPHTKIKSAMYYFSAMVLAKMEAG
jgi:hypothetical protein